MGLPRSRNHVSPEQIRYDVGACSLGPLLVARTERGICAITFGAPPAELVADLEERFPGADLIPDPPGLAPWMAETAALAENPGRPFPLPIDPAGTPFQQIVWSVLREIPPGSTMTYRQVAEHLGSPASTRAVARACAMNAIALAIPCHRVIRSDGALGGYRWGVERKKELLAREAAEY